MTDQVANFKMGTVSTGYDDSATAILLNSGHGFPDPSGDNYNVIWYNSTSFPNPATDTNVEIVRVTALSTNTITVIRNQEGSGASTKNTSGATYKMILGPTAKLVTDLKSEIDSDITTHTAIGDAHHTESHTVASHSDTTATGTELETLTDGSNADALHAHSGSTISDVAYDATSWNNNTDGTSKNSIRDKIETMDTAIGLNTSKVTNATHSGEVTGDTALTITDDAVTYAKIQNVSADERILGNVTAIGSPVAELTKSDVLTMLGVADGADVTGSNAPQTHKASHTDGSDDIQSATNAQKGVATAAHIQAIEANTSKDTNISTTLSVGTVGIDTVAITSDGGADDVTLPAATVASSGMLTTAKWAEIVANNSKVTNVSTNLSEGTSTETTVDVNSSDGTNATLVTASTSRAGLLTKAKFDEIGANTSKTTNATHSGEITGDTILTVDNTAISNKDLVTAVDTDYVLIGDSSDTDNLKKALISDFASAGGDMTVAVYDPTTVADDAFDMDNMTEGTITKILTGTERTKLTSVDSNADVTGDNTPQAHLLSSHTTDTLANLNTIVTDATLIDTGDSRLSDARTPIAHLLGSHTTDTLANLNTIVTDATLIDTADARLSDTRDPTAHASEHTNGTDDIQDATNAVKGLATAAQITKLEGIDTGADVTGDNPPQTHAMSTHTDEGALATLSTVDTTQIEADAVTYDKMQDTSATDKILGRSTAGAGTIEEISCTAAGRAILDDADVAAQRATLDIDQAGTDNSTDVTLDASATTGGLSIIGQDVSYRAATNAQTGYMTDALVINIETNNGKDTNATHTGDVTGDGALTIAAGAVDVTMLANGTDGELITWDTDGAPDTVAVGTATHVLTSNGLGAAPTFQAAGSGTLSTRVISLNTEGGYLPATNPAQLVEEEGATSYIGWSHADFDDTTEEFMGWRTRVPGYDGGNITVRAGARPATTEGEEQTLQFNIYTVGIATSEAYDEATVVDTTVNLSFTLDTTELQTDQVIATTTIDPANVTNGDLMVFKLGRDVATDTLVGDGELLWVELEYTVA